MAKPDQGFVPLEETDNAGCRVEHVHRQAACPAAEDKLLSQSHQIHLMEMYKDEGRKMVLLECGRVGTFYY